MYSVKELSKLQKRSFRNKEGVFLIEGKKIVEEALSSKQAIVQIIFTETFDRNERIYLSQLSISNIPLSIISDSNAERLTSSKTPAGIFAVVRKNDPQLESLFDKKMIVVFEDIKDPGNLGTMIRTADWFGADAVMTTVNGADPYNDKVLRSTMGSIFHLPLYVSDNLLEDLNMLKSKGVKLIVTRPETQTSQPSNQATNQLALVIGNESIGTSPEVDQLADSVMSIPGFGKAESLNASVSFGIIMYELKK